MHTLLVGQASHVTDDGWLWLFGPPCAPLPTQRIRTLLRMKQLRIHPAPPQREIAHPVGFQLTNRLARRRQRQLAMVMHPLDPTPGSVLQHPQLVQAGKTCDISLKHRYPRNT